MLQLTLYTRKGCHLCDQVKEDLASLQTQYPHQVTEIDIEENSDFYKLYALEIPVLQIGPYVLKAPIQKTDLAITLAAAAHRKEQIESLDGRPKISGKPQTWGKADQIVYWIAQHYLKVINLIVLFYVGLPFLAPVFMKANLTHPAKLIYGMYGVVCHQLAYRSFFLFGQQFVYPREIAGMEDLKSYTQATGLPEVNSAEAILLARQFIGNKQVGYKVALCQRDIAIYLGILAFGLIFSLNRNFRALPWYVWILLGIVPIGLDGISQIISQPPFNLIPFRESTPYLRALTGFAFGFFTAWFGFPSVEESMADTRKILYTKRMRLLQAQSEL
ncbi:MAG: hypothetical protein ANABAC_0988 [Anaerolineae bacterium]|jgi:uncharacterized membrane protein|nr:MAG: hypothetical protein ANABAC_0988 [Anaerolineae bacterium]